MRKSKINRWIIGLVALLVVAGTYLYRASPDRNARKAPAVPATSGDTPGGVDDAITEPVTAYFTNLNANSELELVPVTRSVPIAPRHTDQAQSPESAQTEARLVAAIQLLLAGPGAHTPDVNTQLPAGVKLLGVRLVGDTAEVNFSREVEALGGTMRIAGMLAQIGHTVTSVSGVKQAILFVEGVRVGTSSRPFTGDGFLFDTLAKESPNL